jgi:hypothetical protein
VAPRVVAETDPQFVSRLQPAADRADVRGHTCCKCQRACLQFRSSLPAFLVQAAVIGGDKTLGNFVWDSSRRGVNVTRGLDFPPIAIGLKWLSCRCCFPGPAELAAAQTGRTHDRTRPMLQLSQKVLAKAAPSTHDPKRTFGSRMGHFRRRRDHPRSHLVPVVSDLCAKSNSKLSRTN